VRGQTRTLSLELFFDSTRVGRSLENVLDVRLMTDLVAELRADSADHACGAANHLHLGRGTVLSRDRRQRAAEIYAV